MDIMEAINNDTFDNFDVVCDTEDCLQVRCKEGRFVAELYCNGNFVAMLQGNEILIWHKNKVVSNANGFLYYSNDETKIKIFFEDLSNLYD